MPVRLIACDVDGTLTRGDGSIGPLTLESLHKARQRGLWVTLATGRPRELIGMITDQMPGVISHVVAGNGSLVLGLDPHHVVRSISLERDVVVGLVEALRAGLPGVRFALAAHGQLFWEPGLERRLPIPPPGEPVSDALSAMAHGPCEKILTFHPDHDVHALIDLLQPLTGHGFTVSHVGADAAEVSPSGVDKATGLAALCDHLGVSAADVMVFGDNVNDWSMFDWAGHAVAVANADPLTRSRANEVTAASDDDGVGLVLQRVLTELGGTA